MQDSSDREVIVFTGALKVPVQERAAFLDWACAGDENLRHKVEALLSSHDRVGDFLEQPATSAALAPLPPKIATLASPPLDAHRQGDKKAVTGFQSRLRKRKGRINEK